MPRVAALSFVLLAACGEWPDSGGPPISRAPGDWPEFLPLTELLADPGPAPEGEEAATRALLARAEALRARAALLRTPIAGQDDFDALRARLQ